MPNLNRVASHASHFPFAYATQPCLEALSLKYCDELTALISDVHNR